MGEMRELEYPFDSIDILLHQKKYRKIMSHKEHLEIKRIAILSGSTVGDLKGILELFLLNNNIKPQFYEGLYNRFFEEAVFHNQDLNEFRPDVIYIHTTNRNISRLPTPQMNEAEVMELLRGEMERFESVWKSLAEKYNCPIIQNNFDLMPFRVFGNADCYYVNGINRFIAMLNDQFSRYAQNHQNFYLCDINYLSAWFGLEKWSEPGYWYNYKYAMHPEAIPLLAFNVANIIKALYGKNKKAIITDLDNTLWGGVIGDDGPGNIKLGVETPQGIAYYELQQYLKYLKQRGIILCACSKNEEEMAYEGINSSAGVLSEDDFAVIKANWNEKHENIVEICREINLLPESMVFLDDNEVERDSVKAFIPRITVPELNEPAYYRKILDQCGFFECVGFTEDDKFRTEFYRANIERENLKLKYDNYDDYLLSLQMKALVEPFTHVNIERVCQLINKTNQFNLTGIRFSQSELEHTIGSENNITLCARLTDKFGDNGIVSAVIGEFDYKGVLTIVSWVMSCRVFKRHLEYLVFDKLVEKCLEKGIKSIRGIYVDTGRNKLCSDFYSQLGFTKKEQTDERTEWEYLIYKDYKIKNTVIEVL